MKRKLTILIVVLLLMIATHACINIFVFKGDFRCIVVMPLWTICYAVFIRNMMRWMLIR